MLKVQSTTIAEIGQTGTFTGTEQRLSEVSTWLQNHGVKVSNTRLAMYHRTLRELNEARQSGSLTDYHARNGHAWINAMYDSQELIWICNSLRDSEGDAIFERLKRAVKGQELFASDESDSASGRNIGLELSTAGTFVSTGYKVDFGGAADVRVDYNGRDLFVECKRLKSWAKAERRIKDGFQQLRNRYSFATSPSTARGILVLSISKLVNSDFKLNKGSSFIELSQQAEDAAHSFIEKYKTLLAKHSRDKRTIATIILYDAPGQAESILSLSKHVLIVENYWNLIEEKLLKQKISETFARALHKQIQTTY